VQVVEPAQVEEDVEGTHDHRVERAQRRQALPGAAPVGASESEHGREQHQAVGDAEEEIEVDDVHRPEHGPAQAGDASRRW